MYVTNYTVSMANKSIYKNSILYCIDDFRTIHSTNNIYTKTLDIVSCNNFLSKCAAMTTYCPQNGVLRSAAFKNLIIINLKAFENVKVFLRSCHRACEAE